MFRICFLCRCKRELQGKSGAGQEETESKKKYRWFDELSFLSNGTAESSYAVSNLGDPNLSVNEDADLDDLDNEVS